MKVEYLRTVNTLTLFLQCMSMLFTLCDSHQYPAIQSFKIFKMFAQDLLSIARHLLHYMTKESSQGCLFTSTAQDFSPR